MFKLFWANKVTVDGSLQSWAQRRIKLPAIPLIGEEPRTQLAIPWEGPSSPYLDPHGSSLPKGGTRTWNVRLAIILSHYLAFLQANSGGPCFRFLLMPSYKQTLGTDVEPTTSTWGHMAACWVLPPCPRIHPGALIPRLPNDCQGSEALLSSRLSLNQNYIDKPS